MLKNRTFILTLLSLLIISFIWLSIYVAQNPFIPMDLSISKVVQAIQFKGLDNIMLAISIFGELPFSLLSVLLVAFIFFKTGFKREGYFVALTLLSGLIILGIKNLIDRPRPTEFYVRLVEINRFQSYPSGHTLSYVLFFGFLIVLMNHLKNINNRLRMSLIVISYFLIFTIPVSRIYLGAHWFTDVLGGVLLGLICLFPLVHFYLKPHRLIEKPLQ